MIIGVYAAIGEGKDLFAKLFIKHSQEKFENRKFANKLKEVVATLTGIDVKLLEDNDFKDKIIPGKWVHPKTKHPITYRFLLQYIGTDLFRDQFDQNIWVNSLFSNYTNSDNFIITDLRFENEAKAIKDYEGILVRVCRYKTISEWLYSNYFINIFQESSIHNILDIYGNLEVSKHEMIDIVMKYKHLIKTESGLDLYKKVTHQSEIELHNSNIKFDFVIKNNSTITDFSNKVEDFCNKILNKE